MKNKECSNQPKTSSDIPINIGYWNCASGILNKLDLIKEIIQTNELDIFFVSESDIGEYFDLSLLQIQGFDIILPYEQQKKKSRILAFVKSGDKFEQLKFAENNEVEGIAIKNNYSHSTTYNVVVGIYRPYKKESDSTLTEQFDMLLDKLTSIKSSHQNVCFVGDFNVDYFNISNKSYHLSNLANRLTQWCVVNDLVQIVKDHTRSQTYITDVVNVTKESLLDHVYVDNIYIHQSVDVIPATNSDHSLITVKTQGRKLKNSPKEVYIRDWRNYSPEKFITAIKSLTWDSIYYTTGPDQMSRELTTKIQGIYDTLVPKVKCKTNSESDIISPSIQEIKNKRAKLLKKWKKTGLNIYRKSFMKHGKRLKATIKKERKRMIKEATQKKDCNKSLWKIIKKLTKGKNSSIPTLKDCDNNDKAKAEVLASHFEDVVKEKIAVVKDLEDDSQVTPIFDEQVKNLTFNFTEAVIDKAMQNMKSSMSNGHDELPSKLLKDGRTELTTHLTFLFNRVLCCQKIPDSWKIAKILPLHKKGPQNNIKNYRPISNLPSIAKIFEKCLMSILDELKNKASQDLTSDNQHGFKPGHSTTTAALSIQSRIAKAFERKHHVLVITLDLSAAFDLLDKDKLKRRMEIMNYPHQLVNVIHNWLSQRSAFVKVNEEISRTFDVNYGCVQGSVTGPTLFSILLSQLGHVYSDMIRYADDAYFFFEGEDWEKTKETAEKTMPKIIDWLKKSGMLVNVSKTEACLFQQKIPDPKTVSIMGENVLVSKSVKILGLTFSYDLSWYTHIEKITNTCKKDSHAIKLLRQYLDIDDLTRIVQAKVLSKLWYAAPVWMSKSILKQKEISLLNTAVGSVLRHIVQDYERAFNREELHNLLEIPSSIDWGNYLSVSLANKICVNQLPDDLFKDFLCHSFTGQENMRNNSTRFFASNTNKSGLSLFVNRVSDILKPHKDLDISEKICSKVSLKKHFINN